jgi:hypothetical protein
MQGVPYFALCLFDAITLVPAAMIFYFEIKHFKNGK